MYSVHVRKLKSSEADTGEDGSLNSISTNQMISRAVYGPLLRLRCTMQGVNSSS